MRRQIFLAIAAVLFVGSSAPSAQTSLDRCASPLETLDVDGPLQRIVVETWQRSLTFRRQVARLANEPGLAVTVGRWVLGVGSESRAKTEFTRQGDRLRRADVQVKAIALYATVELIAHELEHVLEQLDGVDLARMHSRNGVLVSGDFGRPHFETKRAQLVGRSVAAEYEAPQTVDMGCSDAGGR